MGSGRARETITGRVSRPRLGANCRNPTTVTNLGDYIGVQVLRDLMNRILAKTLTDQTLFGLDNMSCVLVTFNENEEVKAVVKNGKQLRKKIRKIGKTRK
jgi:hypothetical protein